MPRNSCSVYSLLFVTSIGEIILTCYEFKFARSKKWIKLFKSQVHEGMPSATEKIPSTNLNVLLDACSSTSFIDGWYVSYWSWCNKFETKDFEVISWGFMHNNSMEVVKVAYKGNKWQMVIYAAHELKFIINADCHSELWGTKNILLVYPGVARRQHYLTEKMHF